MNFITSDPYKAAKFIKYKTLDEMNQNSQKLINDSILHPDHLIDAFWGIPTIERLEFILSNLPEGTSELALHLGLDHDTIQVPKGIDKKYLPFRQKELNVIKTNEARELLNKLNIEIVQFSDLYWIQNQKIETKSDY